jgi:hypothetical protein
MLMFLLFHMVPLLMHKPPQVSSPPSALEPFHGRSCRNHPLFWHCDDVVLVTLLAINLPSRLRDNKIIAPSADNDSPPPMVSAAKRKSVKDLFSAAKAISNRDAGNPPRVSMLPSPLQRRTER